MPRGPRLDEHNRPDEGTRRRCHPGQRLHLEELRRAAGALKKDKALGLDSITHERCAAALTSSDFCEAALAEFNQTLQAGWTETTDCRLVLIANGTAPPETPLSTSPLMMMPTIRKVLETMILWRLREHPAIGNTIASVLSPEQGGFRIDKRAGAHPPANYQPPACPLQPADGTGL
eukprot:GHVT01060309.1.p1 GENE.GHVT01060309.1~~GHVT01060309.1.p1  ORF type:complete len:176 (-),score=14.43 GHVT01060309.1:474-1001(-)